MSGQESSLFDEIFILLQLVDGKHSLQFVMIGTLCFILGRVALVAQRTSRQTFPSTICRSVGPYARKCFGRSVCPVHCGKTADRIRMPFGVIGRKGPGIRQVVGFWDRSMGRGTVGANLRRAIVTNGDFTAYVSDCAATRPSSQITLGKLLCKTIACYLLCFYSVLGGLCIIITNLVKFYCTSQNQQSTGRYS